MERRARLLGGYEIRWDRTDRGYVFEIETPPEHEQARQEVFALFDQLRASAKSSGVSGAEILAHWLRQEWQRWNPVRK
jgi:hypothetical protein